MRPILCLSLVMAGCGSSSDYAYLNTSPLWDATQLVSTEDGVYVTLPLRGGLLLLAPGAEPTPVDLEGARVRRVEASPDGTTVLASALRTVCTTDLEQPVEDCERDDVGTKGELRVVASSSGASTLDVPSWYGGFQFSEDGRFAVAPFDASARTTGGGVVNLTSVLVVDLELNKHWEVGVGFEATTVLFTDDGAGATTGMVVLSHNEVAVVDLTAAFPTKTATYPLVLDADTSLQPLDVALTPDDRYALITVKNAADLYVLDLVDPSINIVSLSGTPADMVVDVDHDRTLFVYNDRAVVDVLDHALFDLQAIGLDERMTSIHLTDAYALLSAPKRSRDVVRLDLETLRPDEYRLQFTPRQLIASPDDTFAVSFSESSGVPTMEVLDLRRVDGRLDLDPKPFGLDGAGVGAAFADTGDGQQVLLLQEGVDTLYTLAWPSLQVEAVSLPAPPVAVGAIVGGPFWITHASAVGLLSFWEPGGTVSSIHGFATDGMLDDTEQGGL